MATRRSALLAVLMALCSHSLGGAAKGDIPTKLKYDEMVNLDAESLAEGGILSAYKELASKLKRFVSNPKPVREVFGPDNISYSVKCAGITYDIYGPRLRETEGRSWGRATHALFAIVNAQLQGTGVQFYAINSGNDLGGMFLSEAEAIGSRKSLLRRQDWPYIPTLEEPWYGQFH